MKNSFTIFILTVLVMPLHAIEIPEGFIIQELASLGGEILMPESWYFLERSPPQGYEIIISKENAEFESYETGFKITVIPSVKKRTGLTPYQLMFHNREIFKNGAKSVINECEEEHSESLKRICLETIEDNMITPGDDFHVVYSFVSYEEDDMAVILIFGAPESNWEEAEKIYYMMKDFKLIDMEKIRTDGVSNARTIPTTLTVSGPDSEASDTYDVPLSEGSSGCLKRFTLDKATYKVSIRYGEDKNGRQIIELHPEPVLHLELRKLFTGEGTAPTIAIFLEKGPLNYPLDESIVTSASGWHDAGFEFAANVTTADLTHPSSWKEIALKCE